MTLSYHRGALVDLVVCYMLLLCNIKLSSHDGRPPEWQQVEVLLLGYFQVRSIIASDLALSFTSAGGTCVFLVVVLEALPTVSRPIECHYVPC